jgi:hypothetical protein
MDIGKFRMVTVAVTLLGTTVLAACGGNDSTGPAADDISGKYELISVNGISPAPFQFVYHTSPPCAQQECTYEIFAWLTLDDNGSDGGTYQEVEVGHWVGFAKSDTVSNPGTYTRLGTSIAFVCDSCPNVASIYGTIEAGRVTVTTVGMPIQLAGGRIPRVPERSPVPTDPPYTLIFAK